jgi:hypothetical protein
LNDKNETTGFSFSVVLQMDAEAVSGLRDLAPDLRASLSALGDRANPMPIIRRYVEHIGAIHARFREAVKQIEIDSEGLMRGLLDRYAKATPGEKLVGVAVGLENPDGTVSGPEYLVEHRLDYLRYLRVKHLSAANLSIRYVPW